MQLTGQILPEKHDSILVIRKPSQIAQFWMGVLWKNPSCPNQAKMKWKLLGKDTQLAHNKDLIDNCSMTYSPTKCHAVMAVERRMRRGLHINGYESNKGIIRSTVAPLMVPVKFSAISGQQMDLSVDQMLTLVRSRKWQYGTTLHNLTT